MLATPTNRGETLPSPAEWLDHGAQHRTHRHAKHEAKHIQRNRQDSFLAGSEHVSSHSISGVL